jgi:hypothetical protein
VIILFLEDKSRSSARTSLGSTSAARALALA